MSRTINVWGCTRIRIGNNQWRIQGGGKREEITGVTTENVIVLNFFFFVTILCIQLESYPVRSENFKPKNPLRNVFLAVALEITIVTT